MILIIIIIIIIIITIIIIIIIIIIITITCFKWVVFSYSINITVNSSLTEKSSPKVNHLKIAPPRHVVQSIKLHCYDKRM